MNPDSSLATLALPDSGAVSPQPTYVGMPNHRVLALAARGAAIALAGLALAALLGLLLTAALFGYPSGGLA